MPLSLQIQASIENCALTPMKIPILALQLKEQGRQIGVVTGRVVSPCNNLDLSEHIVLNVEHFNAS
jgi:hypothetical protein